MTKTPITLSIEDHLPNQSTWDAALDSGCPFSSFSFWHTLIETGCVGPGTSWRYVFVCARENGVLVGLMPLWIKHDSYGEYVFDFGWADAYARAGLKYYPKVIVAAPFTPVNNQKILATTPEIAAQIVACAWEWVNEQGYSGLHGLFVPEAEHHCWLAIDAQRRDHFQYHWRNHNFATFDDWLDTLKSKKRKQVRQELAALAEAGVSYDVHSGTDLGRNDAALMFEFYNNTHQGRMTAPYLNQAFFERYFEVASDTIVMVKARIDDEIVGASMSMRTSHGCDPSVLYGRYWGASRGVRFLHFACAYYEPIRWCIANNVGVFEAGAQGEHKFLRGFAAVPTYSFHAMTHPGGRNAIAQFLADEREHIDGVITSYNRVSPDKLVRQKARSED